MATVVTGSLNAEVVVATRCELGEAPTWDAAAQRLLWLDIDGQVLHQIDAGGTHLSTALEERATCVVPDAGGGLIVAASLRVAHLEPDGTIGGTIARLPRDVGDRTNDGRCDPHGRLWVGTVDTTGGATGALFIAGGDGHVESVKSGVQMSNGIDWSPDGRTCYYVDSLTHRLASATIDDSGRPTKWESLVEVEPIPDGLSVDVEGCIWVAMWDGRGVHRFTPSGDLDRIVNVPHGFVTSCAFGGPDHDTLYITTARTGLGDAELAEQPDAGALFAVDPGVRGRGYTPFALHDG